MGREIRKLAVGEERDSWEVMMRTSSGFGFIWQKGERNLSDGGCLRSTYGGLSLSASYDNLFGRSNACSLITAQPCQEADVRRVYTDEEGSKVPREMGDGS